MFRGCCNVSSSELAISSGSWSTTHAVDARDTSLDHPRARSEDLPIPATHVSSHHRERYPKPPSGRRQDRPLWVSFWIFRGCCFCWIGCLYQCLVVEEFASRRWTIIFVHWYIPMITYLPQQDRWRLLYEDADREELMSLQSMVTYEEIGSQRKTNGQDR